MADDTDALRAALTLLLDALDEVRFRSDSEVAKAVATAYAALDGHAEIRVFAVQADEADNLGHMLAAETRSRIRAQEELSDLKAKLRGLSDG